MVDEKVSVWSNAYMKVWNPMEKFLSKTTLFFASLCILLAACAVKETIKLHTHETRWGNGQLKESYTYCLGIAGSEIRHGKSNIWSYTGSKSSSIEYVKGVKQGLQVSWYSNGSKRLEGRWAHNKKVGVWTGWNPSGEIDWQCTYRDSKIDGKKTYWNNNQVTKEEVYNKDGNKIEVICWHEKDKKWLHGYFRNGKKYGKWTYWDKQGNIEAIGEWKDGKPWNGLCAIPMEGGRSMSIFSKLVQYADGEPTHKNPTDIDGKNRNLTKNIRPLEINSLHYK